MMTNQQTLLNRYQYDPLDRLADCESAGQTVTRRFYLKDRLSIEIQGSVQRSIFQQDDQLLAQRQHRDGTVETALLATDQQRSVLQLLDVTLPHPLVYTPYGHRASEHGLLSFLGFNGERPDPVTGHYLLGNGYRSFNPVLMQFNSPDSLSPFGDGGLNPYAYCAGDPVNHQDPTGHISWAGLMLKHFPKAMTSAKKATIASKPNPITDGMNTGPFHQISGMPAVLENIIGNVDSDSLVALSLASKDMNRLIKSHVRPIIKGPAKELQGFLHHDLKSIAMGQSKGHLPSQVLQDETLNTFAKRAKRGANPMPELANAMAFNVRLKAQSLESRSFLELTPKKIRE